MNLRISGLCYMHSMLSNIFTYIQDVGKKLELVLLFSLNLGHEKLIWVIFHLHLCKTLLFFCEIDCTAMQQKKILYEIVIEIGLSLDRKIALLDTCYSFYAKKNALVLH